MAKKKTLAKTIWETAATAAVGSFVPYFPMTKKALANNSRNDRPVIGCIGVGSMGTGDAEGHANFGDVIFAAAMLTNVTLTARRITRTSGKAKPTHAKTIAKFWNAMTSTSSVS